MSPSASGESAPHISRSVKLPALVCGGGRDAARGGMEPDVGDLFGASGTGRRRDDDLRRPTPVLHVQVNRRGPPATAEQKRRGSRRDYCQDDFEGIHRARKLRGTGTGGD